MKNPFGKKKSWMSATYALLIIGVVALISIMSAVPPVSRDALTHHLAVPKLWIENGGMFEIPHLIFSYNPMNLDLLYVIPMLFGNDIIPKYIHFLFALATAWLIHSYLKQRTSYTLSLLGALIFLSTPVIVKLSINVYVDLGLVFFSWSSIFLLFKWARSQHSPKYLILSAILCGLGLGTKYNGLVVLFLLTLFVSIVYMRTPGQTHFKTEYAVGYPILFFLIAITVFSPWMIRNYNYTGNPIYPLYNHLANKPSENTDITNMSMKPWLQRRLIYKESALEAALIPLRIFFEGKDDNPRFFDGKLNPILFLCPLLLIIKRKELDAQIKLERLFLVSYSVLFLLYASFMVDMRIRYIAPIIPPLVILAVFGIQEILLWIDEISRKRARVASQWVFACVIILFLSINVKYVAAVFKSVNPVPFIIGETTRDEYLRNKLPDYSAIAFANQIQYSNMKIFALFIGNRLYYFDKDVEFGNQAIAGMVAGTQAEHGLALRLNEKGYTHCIIGINFLEQWANRIFSYDQKMKIYQWLEKDCKLLFLENGYAVFKLIPPEADHSFSH